jgi:hypothetical protein
MAIAILGVNLGKNACSVVGVDTAGADQRVFPVKDRAWNNASNHLAIVERNVLPMQRL